MLGGAWLATSARGEEKPTEQPPREFGAGLTLEGLACMSWPELEALYRASEAGAIPCGETRGVTIPCLSAKHGKAKQRVSSILWKGKIFDPECEELTNRWLVGKAVKAHVFIGESWIDGKPSIISDYKGTSPIVWKNIRDEIRQVGCGLYLGAMIRRACPTPEFRMFFALELCG
jgi:hypothetical protein